MRRERGSVGVVFPATCFTGPTQRLEVRAVSRRCIGLDVHRDFAQVAIWQDGLVGQAGRIATTPVRLLAGRIARVVVSNPHKTRAIAEAKVKTDKVDAEILAQL